MKRALRREVVIASLALLAISNTQVNAAICLEGKFDAEKALMLAWGDQALDRKGAVWSLASFLSTRPAKKKMLEGSPMEDAELVITRPDKLLKVSPDNSSVILLAGTTPRNPGELGYTCSACEPLLGAQQWSRQGNTWCLAAEDRAIMRMGGVGDLSYEHVKPIKMGPKKYGILFEDDVSRGGSATVETTLVLPSEGSFQVVFHEVTGDGYEEDFQYTGKVTFIPGQNPEYFDLRVVTSGTNIDKQNHEIPWNRELVYVMKEGRYVLKSNRPRSNMKAPK